MKKNIIFSKYYKHLRNNVFANLELNEFLEVYSKFKRLRMQYKFLQIANFLEKRNIPKVEIFLFRLIFKVIDFIRWKFYDLFMFLINGRQFNLFGVTIFCGRQRKWQNNRYCRRIRKNKTRVSKSNYMY